MPKVQSTEAGSQRKWLVEQLAERVYRLMLRELRLERLRGGGRKG